MSKIKIELDYPVVISGIETSVINIRRPKVADILIGEKKGKSDAEKEIAIFSSLCEIEPEVIKELDMSDYKKLQQEYESFLS